MRGVGADEVCAIARTVLYALMTAAATRPSSATT